MIVLEMLVAGFFSAIGWWSANHYVVEPYLEPKTKVEKDVNDK
jgi:hypothetical protein